MMKIKFSLIFLFFVLNLLVVAQDIKVISSTQSSITIQYTPSFTDTTFTTVQGQQYVSFNIKGTMAENYQNSGMPEIPERVFNIGVPSEFGNTIQVVNAEYTSFMGKLLPVPEYVKDSVSYYSKYSESVDYNNSNIAEQVTFGEFGLMRELYVQAIKIYPIQFNAASRTIKLLKQITFRVNYSSPKSAVQLIKGDNYSSVILNWNVAKNWGKASVSTKLAKTNSTVLSTGNWYKFETPTEGIYKIDQTFLKGLGIDVTTVDPRTIKIYGMGGAELEEDPSLANNQGMIENSVYVSGESDGSFDAADFVLFYGRPTEFWEYNSASKSILRVKNFFSKTNYYWLTYGGTTGKRMASKQSLGVQNAYQQQSTKVFVWIDKDSINIGKTGREYLGDYLDYYTKSRTYVNSLSGIVPSSTIVYKLRVVNASEVSIPYTMEESGTPIMSNTAYYGSSGYIYGTAYSSTFGYSGTLTDERSTLKFAMTSGSSDARLYMDYLEISYNKKLNAVNDNLLFFSKDTTAAIQYTLSNFSNSSIQTFDITDFSNVKLVSNAQISGGQFTFQANEVFRNVKKYLTVSPTAYLTPSNGAKVNNSNVRGSNTGSQMIVIAPREFQTQAESYLNYRLNQSPYKLSAQLFYVDDIMNEFSSGVTDPTAIRDFLKYAYENWSTKPFYVLLFGNGTYDILNKEKANNNFIPAYETTESLREVSSYPTDDYYARVSGNDSFVDLAIGRLPIRSTTDAQNVVDKIIKYETGLDKGLWRNKITLVADDNLGAQGSDEVDLHTRQSETLSLNFIPKYLDQSKIYLVAYPTTYTGLGRRKPDVNKAIIDAMNNGTLIINWVGHGNPDVWAHENVFDKATTIPQIKNTEYFFLTAATCDFGEYDDPTQQSSTEIMVNMKDAGAIGIFSASRVTYSRNNAAINDSLYSNLFKESDEDNLPARIGKAYFQTKQSISDLDNDSKFHLYCDPAIRLNAPHIPAQIDSVNSKSLQSNIQINALGNVKIKGTVRNVNGTLNQFNGEAIISVFDSEQSKYYKDVDMDVVFSGGLIYRGRVTITNGAYETEFVVPKDISYENKNGKIVSYVYNESNDGVGYSNNIIVGGTDANAKDDGKGPSISIYFDDINYGDGYLVNPDFTLLLKISDESGLNTTGTGIGHKLQAILNDNEGSAIDLTNYFVGDLNSGGKSGIVKYLFTDQEPGEYKIKIKAWDVFNNYSSQESSFKVVNSSTGITLQDVYNFPNPFSSSTTFTFQHNYTDAIDAKIKIYTVAGRMIKELEAWNLMDRFVKIDWDGRDNDGNQIANGTYLYKLIVESVDGKFKENVLGKLAVIR